MMKRMALLAAALIAGGATIAAYHIRAPKPTSHNAPAKSQRPPNPRCRTVNRPQSPPSISSLPPMDESRARLWPLMVHGCLKRFTARLTA